MRTRKHLTKIAATVALVAGAAGVAGVGTFGAYTDTTKAEAVVSSGKVSVLINGDDTGVQVPVPDMLTSDVAMFPITIQRADKSAELGTLNLSTAIAGDALLTDNLTMRIDLCSVAWEKSGSSLNCPGQAQPIGTVAIKQKVAIPVTDLNSGKAFYAMATLTLNPNAPAESAGKAATITWILDATQRGGKTTVVDPVRLTKS